MTIASPCRGLWLAGVVAAGLGAGCAQAQPAGLVALEPVVEGLESPVFVTHAGDGSGRLFILEQAGRVLVLEGGSLVQAPFLNIEGRVLSGGERGLLGLAFHPDFPDEPRLFVNYTRRPDGATVIAEFQVAPQGRARPASERVLLTIPQPYANHNGGMIAFGPGGLLYIGMGDGGSGGDPQNNAQNEDVLLGKMLRIDVDRGDPYAIPPGNPFATSGGRPEIFAQGLRNPWRFSFDRAEGDLWVADVGQNAIEEVSIVRLGGNYGWRFYEGTRAYRPEGRTGRLIPPVAEYEHDGGRCSITGGYVYRGEALPELAGAYVFGDYCSGEILGFQDGEQRVLLETGLAISSFGEDEAGELYLVDRGGTVQRITARGS